MKTALVLLTLALAVGVGLAPAAAASCPPTPYVLFVCPAIPLGQGVGCLIDGTGEFVAEAASDCL